MLPEIMIADERALGNNAVVSFEVLQQCNEFMLTTTKFDYPVIDRNANARHRQ